MGVPVEHGDHSCGAFGGQALIDDPAESIGETVAALHRTVEQFRDCPGSS
jgi:hypothetical protein